MCRTTSATHRSLPEHLVLEPGERNDEQRRQDEAKQRIDPDQRDVEGAESETDPEGAERAVRFQDVAPRDVGIDVAAEKIAARQFASQRALPDVRRPDQGWRLYFSR
jgi:hypothetical protein